MNSHIETFSGRTFDPLAPVFADIAIVDIAHALANQCRFSGHVRFRYSVAEHSVRVSELLASWGTTEDVQLWGLLHDASEAYLIDLPSPIKKAARSKIGKSYREIETSLMAAVCKRFGLLCTEPAIVKAADETMLATEVRDLMHGDRSYWQKLSRDPLEGRIRPWACDVAEAEFLRLYQQLTGDKRR